MSKRTILFDLHQAAGGLMIDFAGWQMPLHYGSQLLEHQQVRTNAGMFDVSHMGIIDVIGEDSRAFLSWILANNINKLIQPGAGLYSCMLNTDGKILDDLIVYYVTNQFYRLVVNAATTTKDLEWISSNAEKYKVQIKPRLDLAIIAVQGPSAIDSTVAVFDAKFTDKIRQLKRFGCMQADDIFIARTGYTGENGLELILPVTQAVMYWERLLLQEVMPIGLGARDTLRLEAGYNLYGTDMDESVTPLESNVAWTVALEPVDRDFIGRRAIERQIEQGIPTQLIGIRLIDKGVLRHGQKIYADDQEVGVVTSGSFSPTLLHAIGFARVLTPLKNDYFVEIRGIKHALRIVKPPFV